MNGSLRGLPQGADQRSDVLQLAAHTAVVALDLKRLGQLKGENGKQKKLVADLSLAKAYRGT